MSIYLNKDEILQLIEMMPENVTVDEVMAELYLKKTYNQLSPGLRLMRENREEEAIIDHSHSSWIIE